MSGIIDTVGAKSGIVGSDVYPAGHVVQTVTDNYTPSSSIAVTTTGADVLGSNLEVTITPTSTSNKLLINCFIPDGYNNNLAAVGCHSGFRFHADFSGTDGNILGDKEFIGDHHGYKAVASHLILTNLFYCTTVNAPITTAIKIRPWFKSTTSNYAIFANSSDATFGVGCLIVQEIKA